MIPKNISREHIIKAIKEIKKVGIPSGRSSKKFHLEYKGEFYPPKYTIALANKYANGKELASQEFSGGEEANTFLKGLGFKIVQQSSKIPFAHRSRKERKDKSMRHGHNERCPECKRAIKKLLEKIYGKVELNYRFQIGTHPEDFRNTPYYHRLKNIHNLLQSHRGFQEFTKSKTLPNCDFFVSSPGFIVEFDESQHFTELRKIALENYPEELELGFDKKKWIKLCEQIKAKDNDPPYRDEQRAWYDTLRDFLPLRAGLKPTVRLFAKDYVWCDFDPDNSGDLEEFREILGSGTQSWQIEVREEQNPSVARIIMAGEWRGNALEARQLLENICKKWPKGRKVNFLITCGGFIQFDWPESISREDIGDNINPNRDCLDTLLKEAEKWANSVLDGGLGKQLSKFTDYITLGIDSRKEKVSTTWNRIGEPHIELVFLKDLREDKLYWTGKSYPTPGQEKGLVRIADLNTHFLNLEIGKVMILGCHDLTIFNPRSRNARGWRRKVNHDFKELARKEKPQYVLHHPHTTVKGWTWLCAWAGLTRMLPSVKQYAGAGRYYESDRECSQWDTLDKVLRSTGNTATIDFVIW